MTEMEKMEKLVEATKKDIEICDAYRKLMGSDNITEDAERRIKYLWSIQRSADFANTMEDFIKNISDCVKIRGFDESDVRRIRFYVESHINEEDE